MIDFLQMVLSGIAVGSAYALMGLGMVLIYKASEVPNFVQGEMALLPVFIAYMLLSTQEIQIINMDTFIVDLMALGSMPQAAGYAANTDKVFISQQHPSGRMTFMDVDGANVKTITGYTLNDQRTN